MQIALALSPGVSADECEAFTMVFDRLADAQPAGGGLARGSVMGPVEVVGVAAAVGHVEGPGGGQQATVTFADVTAPDVVIVPGGLGCAKAAVDSSLGDWLRSVAPTCQWMAASSTGTVVVAAAGLLHGQTAATHWLASPLLESYGSATSESRVVEVGNIITCEGHITAMHVALLVTLRIAGPEAVRRVRDDLAREGPRPSVSKPTARWQRWFEQQRAKRRPQGPAKPRNRELVAPDLIEFDPVVRRR